MNNRQSAEEFCATLPVEEAQLVEVLRNLILDSSDRITEKMAYGVPFYYAPKRLFYIWPASVKWGGIKENKGVLIGFCRGHELNNEDLFLEGTENNQMRKRYIKDLPALEKDRFRILAAIQESLELT